MDEVFVAQLVVDGPLTSRSRAALRDQAAAWFGPSGTRHLGTEVTPVDQEPGAPARWLVSARFIRQPPPPPQTSGLMRAASWLGSVPRGLTQDGSPDRGRGQA